MAIKEAVFITFFITLLVATDGKQPDESTGKHLCNENFLEHKKINKQTKRKLYLIYTITSNKTVVSVVLNVTK